MDNHKTIFMYHLFVSAGYIVLMLLCLYYVKQTIERSVSFLHKEYTEIKKCVKSHGTKIGRKLQSLLKMLPESVEDSSDDEETGNEVEHENDS